MKQYEQSDRAMETETIQKNRGRWKNPMSRKTLFAFTMLAFLTTGASLSAQTDPMRNNKAHANDWQAAPPLRAANATVELLDSIITKTAAGVYDAKSVYQYDSRGNLLLEIEYQWDGAAWGNGYKYEYQYDANNNQTLEIYYQWDGAKWVISYTSQYYYSTFNTGIETVETQNLKIYPNPVKDELIIALNKGINPLVNVEIFDLSGKQVVNGQWSNGKSINVQNLPAGVYFVKIGNYRNKFIKE